MKPKIKLISIIAAILCVFVFSSAISFAASSLKPDGNYYIDRVGVLSDATKKFINERNKNLVQNCRGAQMCVVILDSIGGADIEEFAYDLFTDWSLGRAGEDNGVLILMLTGDDDYWFMTGTGLEDVLSTEVLRSIISVYCEPSFSVKDYDTAVSKTFARLNEELCSFYGGVDPNGIANPALSTGDSFTGGSSGQTNYNDAPYGLSCNDVSFPTHYHAPRGCSACNACSLSCAACTYACGSCGGCRSCSSFGGLIFIIIVVYVLLKVFSAIGRSHSGRVNRASGFYHTARRAGGFMNGHRPGGSAGRHGSGSFGGFKPGGGSAGHSGAGRSSFGGFKPGGGSAGRSGAGRSSFGGFKPGGGGTRGGGVGRK